MDDFQHITDFPLSELEMRKMILELQTENAALKKSILNAEVLAEYDPAHGHRDWWSGGCWLRSGQQLMIIDRTAIDTAMKEDTNVTTK